MMRWGLAAGAVVLIALPVAAFVLGRPGLVPALVGVGLSALASFAAYRVAVAVRRRIDAIGAGEER
jgi:uncharacterized membrane protein YgaE (UPF0421/DUF939 family)